MAENKEQTHQVEIGEGVVNLRKPDDREIILVDTSDPLVSMQTHLVDNFKDLCGIDFNYLIPNTMERPGKRRTKSAVDNLAYNRELVKFEDVNKSNDLEYNRVISHKRLVGTLNNHLFELRDSYIEFNKASVEFLNEKDDVAKSAIKQECGLYLDQMELITKNIQKIYASMQTLDELIGVLDEHNTSKLPYIENAVMVSQLKEVSANDKFRFAEIDRPITTLIDLNQAEDCQTFTADRIKKTLDNMLNFDDIEVESYLLDLRQMIAGSMVDYPAPDIKKTPTAHELKKTTESPEVFVVINQQEHLQALTNAIDSLIHGYTFSEKSKAQDLFSNAYDSVHLKSDYTSVDNNVKQFLHSLEPGSQIVKEEGFHKLFHKYVELSSLANPVANTVTLSQDAVEWLNSIMKEPMAVEHDGDEVRLSNAEGMSNLELTEEEMDIIEESRSEYNPDARGGWNLFGMDKQNHPLDSDKSELERD